MKCLVLAAFASAAVASGAGAQPKPDDTCFLTRDLRGHTVGGANTLYFDVNGRSIYRIETTDNCLTDVTRSDPIVLRDRGLGKICNPLDLELNVRGSRCIIGKLSKLTPTEASALPKRLQP